MRYQKEIDGLRAVAVLSVVLYHAGLTCVPGGFVGVDVFFVISGYLITQIIHDDLENGQFSIARFYERRIRRIVPALFVMVAVVSLMAYFILLPEHFKRFGASIVALTLGSSNIYFWLRVENVGYFAEGAHNFPLLHSWSLSVEEQFYIFFPLVMLWAVKYLRFRYAAEALVFALSILSFVFGLWMVQRHPAGAFYFTPARAWELLIGALCTFVPRPLPLPRVARELLALGGLALIVLMIFLFSVSAPFPGAPALLPTIGAACIMLAGRSGPSMTGTILSVPPLRYVGAISYSLYLWHWPLIVLAQYYAIGPLSSKMMAGVIVSSVIAATCSWWFIEQPIRLRRVLSDRKHLFLTAALCGIVCIAAGLAMQLQGGMMFRSLNHVAYLEHFHTMTSQNAADCSVEFADKSLAKPCRFNPGSRQNVVLWGDSHAEAMLDGFIAAAHKTNTALTYYAKLGCPPVIGVERGLAPSFLFGGMHAGCDRFASDAEQRIVADKTITLVILVARWQAYINGPFGLLNADGNSLPKMERAAALQKGLSATITALQAAGKQVAVLYPLPEDDYNIPTAAARMEMYGRDARMLDIPLAAYQTKNAQGIAMLNALPKNVIRIHPEQAMCDATTCHFQWPGQTALL